MFLQRLRTERKRRPGELREGVELGDEGRREGTRRGKGRGGESASGGGDPAMCHRRSGVPRAVAAAAARAAAVIECPPARARGQGPARPLLGEPARACAAFLCPPSPAHPPPQGLQPRRRAHLPRPSCYSGRPAPLMARSGPATSVAFGSAQLPRRRRWASRGSASWRSATEIGEPEIGGNAGEGVVYSEFLPSYCRVAAESLPGRPAA